MTEALRRYRSGLLAVVVFFSVILFNHVILPKLITPLLGPTLLSNNSPFTMAGFALMTLLPMLGATIVATAKLFQYAWRDRRAFPLPVALLLLLPLGYFTLGLVLSAS